MDEEKEVTEVKKEDAGSPQVPVTNKQSSPEMEAEIERRAQLRASDILSKRGDKVRPLEDRVKELEVINESLKETQLKTTAEKFGLTVEQVKSLGISDPAKVEAIATTFGKTKRQAEPDFQPDSNKTAGGSGELTAEMVSKMTPDEKFQRRKEITEMRKNLFK